jgi:hypothetical protein
VAKDFEVDSKTRLEKAMAFEEPDRVPIELQISPLTREMEEAQDIVEFIDTEADNFHGAGIAKWGFLGLESDYSEEIIEDVPGDYKRLRRSHKTDAGEFYAITKHKYTVPDPSDFHWERRFIHTIEEMERVADASRKPVLVDPENHRKKLETIGNRGIANTGLLHPMGFLVRNSNMEEVYGWLMLEKDIMHRFCKNTNTQIAETVEEIGKAGITGCFGVCAHEMLIPPWIGMDLFNEYVFPYDKMVNDAVHSIGGKVRAHCHGNCMEFLERMSEMGIDIIEPLEPAPYGDVNLKEAKRRVGDRMVLSGNIISQEFITLSQEDVKDLVKQAIQDAAHGGGFTLRCTGGHAGTGSADKEQTMVILDRIRAYIEAGLEYGTYPIK